MDLKISLNTKSSRLTLMGILRARGAAAGRARRDRAAPNIEFFGW
jgi:hypothetical protein